MTERHNSIMLSILNMPINWYLILYMFCQFHFNTEMGTFGVKNFTHIYYVIQDQGNSDIGMMPQILEGIMFWQINICVELMLKFSNMR